jgi:surface protein
MITNLLSFGDNLLTVGGNALSISSVDPYNPLNLPPYTIRLQYNNGFTPTFYDGTAVRVSTNPNVWDFTYNRSSYWTNMFKNQTDLIGVLGANTSSVTYMAGMFEGCGGLKSVAPFDLSRVINTESMFSGCYGLTTVPAFNTRSATDMEYMFESCRGLIAVPLLNTSSAQNVYRMFADCLYVKSGALALYQQMSTQAVPPSIHDECFDACGELTDEGSDDLVQIPKSWGGKGA